MKKISIFIALILIFTMIAVVANAAELTNVAKGKTYTASIDEEGDPNYGYEEGTTSGYGDGPNGVRQRLTDGVVAGADGGEIGDNGALVGGYDANVATFVIDLGSTIDGIKEFNMDLYKNESWGIYDPISVEYFISEDNVNFTSVGKITVDEAEVKEVEGYWEGAWNFRLQSSEALSARYVKAEVEVSSFVWSSEIQVFAEGVEDVPQTGDAGVYGAIALLIASAGAAVVVTAKRTRV